MEEVRLLQTLLILQDCINFCIGLIFQSQGLRRQLCLSFCSIDVYLQQKQRTSFT